MEKYPDIQEKLISSSEIADLLGIGNAAISNYKRRHRDTFPLPAYASISGRFTLYWIADITEWITDRHGDLTNVADNLERKAAHMTTQAERLRTIGEGKPR